MSFDAASYAHDRFELAAGVAPGDTYTTPSAHMQHVLHVPEGTHVTLLGRVRKATNALILQADVSSVSLRVFERPANAPASEVYSGYLEVSEVIFDALQTDASWRGDSTGYNFKYSVDAAQLAAIGGVTSTYEVTIKLASGAPIRQAWEVHATSFLGTP